MAYPKEVLDTEQMLEYICGDRELASQMIDLFFEDAAASVPGIKKAFAARDYEQLYSCAHALKGNAANLRAQRFTNYVQALATAAKTDHKEADSLMNEFDIQYEQISTVLREWQKTLNG
ncbi:MAG TPA: Hpt domain-containing protein [Oligoflexia bacterium]|nr:Hpt domain-containing protein [Oligoflexia bacterium]